MFHLNHITVKIFRLLLVLLVASCSWGALHAQCNLTAGITVGIDTHNNIDTLRSTVTGATAPVSYQWTVDGTTLGANTPTVISQLTPGYRMICLTVTDSAGCSAGVCDTVLVPTSFCGNLAVTFHDSVNGSDPLLVASVTGPTPWQCTFVWSTGSTGYQVTPASPGSTYCVTVTDPNTGCTTTGCTTYCTFSGSLRDSIGATSNYFSFVNNNGVPSLQFYWNGMRGTSHYQTSNTASLVKLIVVDANGCFFVDSIHPHPCHLSNTITYTHDAFNRYAFQSAATLGTAPFSYAWTINGYTATGATSSTLSDSLVPGTYQICSTVTDANYCQSQTCDTVVVSAALQCHFSLGLHDTLISSSHFIAPYLYDNTAGATSYSYQWASGTILNTDSVLPGVHNYCLTVTDNVGCSASGCYNTCTLTAAATAVASGNGWNQHVTVSGSVGTVHYHWSSGDSTANFFTTTRGVYHVTVTDSSGCSVVLTDTAGSACYFSGGISVLQNTGSAVILSAGVYNNHGSVSYIWSGGSAFGHIDTITSSGRYCVTATDSIGCATTLCDSFVVGCHLVASITDSFTGNAFLLTAHADSGDAPYGYYWNGLNQPPSTSTQLVSINGRHCLFIKDHSGCSVLACDSVYQPCNIHVSIADSNYGTSHILNANVTGGSLQSHPFIRWTDASNTALGFWPQLVVQISGSYCVFVQDTNGCTTSACDTVNLGCHLVTSVTYTSNAANLYTFTSHISGGSGRYSHDWRVDNYATGMNALDPYSTTLSVGLHHICLFVYDTVTNCTDSFCLSVTVPANGCALTASITQSVTGSVAILTAHASGAHGPLTYYWPAGSTSAILTAIQSGTYCVTITDSAGCTATACDTLTLNTCSLHAAYTSTHTGNVYVFAGTSTGAHGPVTYQWQVDGGSLATGSPYTATLVAGTHQICLYARDSTLCRDSLCQTLTVTSTGCAISGYIKDSVRHITWVGNVHYYVPVISNGTAPYTYHWSNGTTGSVLYSGFWQPTFNGTVTVTDANGCSAVLHMNSAYVDTFCGNVFNDLNGNGVQNSGETGVAGQTVYLYAGNTVVATATTDAYGHYAIPVHPGTYTIQYTAGTSYAITIPLGTSTTPNHAQYGPFTISTNANNYCGYNFGIRSTNVTITGYVYLDANNNGIFDAGETPVANQLVHVGPHAVYTNANGQYTYVGAAGTYAITYTPSSAYSAYTVVPSSHSVTASVPGTTYGGNNFGLQQTSTACNITTTVIPITTITAGYPSWYYIYVSNHGTNVASGTMTFYYDPALTFDHASPTAASVNAATYTASFIYAGLQPGTYTVFYVYFMANTTVTVGQSTFEMATATDNCIESNFADNTDTLHQIATGSWDPNAKTVTPAGEGAQGLIRAGQELRYTLNFQNTGTAPAVNVVLHDSLPATLDPSTIRVLGSSHPDYVVEVEGQELTCRYSQIMLPDSFDSEAESHGFLSFAISPVAGIADGTQIQNTASIYFDYNDAVVTNTTLNTIDYTLSVKDVIGGATITVQPNPFSTYTTIRVTGADMHDATLEVYNGLGQIAGTTTPSEDGVFTLQRGGLSAGIYSYQIRQSGRTIGGGKLVVE